MTPTAGIAIRISINGCEPAGTSHITFVMSGGSSISTRGDAAVEMTEEADKKRFLFG